VLGFETVCDGIDNDNNGIVDDVNKEGDGVCDCLRIATLGEAGPYYEGSIFEEWLEARSDTAAVALGNAPLTAELLDGIQILVVQDLVKRTTGEVQMTEAEKAEEQVALYDWVHNGGGLVTLVGYQEAEFDCPSINALLTPFGVSYGLENLCKDEWPTWPVTDFSVHPTTEEVTAIGINNGKETVGDGEVIATCDGLPAAMALEIGEGKLFMWGDEWITYNSQWEDAPEYQVERFWLNIFKWVTPIDKCQVPIIVV
jgi:hypothetical protein